MRGVWVCFVKKIWVGEGGGTQPLRHEGEEAVLRDLQTPILRVKLRDCRFCSKFGGRKIVKL